MDFPNILHRNLKKQFSSSVILYENFFKVHSKDNASCVRILHFGSVCTRMHSNDTGWILDKGNAQFLVACFWYNVKWILYSVTLPRFETTPNIILGRRTCFITNKFEHVGGRSLYCKVQLWGGVRALYSSASPHTREQNGWQTDTTENITFPQLRWRVVERSRNAKFWKQWDWQLFTWRRLGNCCKKNANVVEW